MSTNFPTSLDTLSNPSGAARLSTDHATQHANANDAIEALQAKVGVDSSAVATSLDYKVAQLELGSTVYTISDGAAFEIDPGNGSVQTVTLGASRTPKATNFEAGQTLLLGVDDGASAYSLTWTDATFGGTGVVWNKAGGTATAPALAATGYTWILLWKVGSQVYGGEVGQP